jgi:hypothetical protein
MDAKKKLNKVLLDKDKEMNRLKNHNKILLTKVKKLKHLRIYQC